MVLIAQGFFSPHKNTDGKTEFHTQHHFHLFPLKLIFWGNFKNLWNRAKLFFLSGFLHLVMCEKKYMSSQYPYVQKKYQVLKEKITEGSSLSQSHLTQPSPHSDCSSSARILLEKCWQGILQPYSGLANLYIVHTRKIFPALIQIK